MSEIKPFRRYFSKYGFWMINIFIFFMLTAFQYIEFTKLENATPRQCSEMTISILLLMLWVSFFHDIWVTNKTNSISKKLNIITTILMKNYGVSEKDLEKFKKLLIDEDGMEEEDLKPFNELKNKVDDVPNPKEYAKQVVSQLKGEKNV